MSCIILYYIKVYCIVSVPSGLGQLEQVADGAGVDTHYILTRRYNIRLYGYRQSIPIFHRNL